MVEEVEVGRVVMVAIIAKGDDQKDIMLQQVVVFVVKVKEAVN